MNLQIPLRTSSRHGFFQPDNAKPYEIAGLHVSLLADDVYTYIRVINVTEEEAPALVEKIKVYVSWAAINIGFSIQVEPGSVQKADGPIFNGHLPTLYPSNMDPRPFRASTNHRTSENGASLLSAIHAASQLPILSSAKKMIQFRYH